MIGILELWTGWESKTTIELTGGSDLIRKWYWPEISEWKEERIRSTFKYGTKTTSGPRIIMRSGGGDMNYGPRLVKTHEKIEKTGKC